MLENLWTRELMQIIGEISTSLTNYAILEIQKGKRIDYKYVNPTFTVGLMNRV